MFGRPPLLEEPFAQTLSGKTIETWGNLPLSNMGKTLRNMRKIMGKMTGKMRKTIGNMGKTMGNMGKTIIMGNMGRNWKDGKYGKNHGKHWQKLEPWENIGHIAKPWGTW